MVSRADSVVKSTYFSCKGPELNSQHAYQEAHNHMLTTAPEDPTAFLVSQEPALTCMGSLSHIHTYVHNQLL